MVVCPPAQTQIWQQAYRGAEGELERQFFTFTYSLVLPHNAQTAPGQARLDRPIPGTAGEINLNFHTSSG